MLQQSKYWCRAVCYGPIFVAAPNLFEGSYEGSDRHCIERQRLYVFVIDTMLMHAEKRQGSVISRTEQFLIGPG